MATIITRKVGCDGCILEEKVVCNCENPPVTLLEYEAQRFVHKDCTLVSALTCNGCDICDGAIPMYVPRMKPAVRFSYRKNCALLPLCACDSCGACKVPL